MQWYWLGLQLPIWRGIRGNKAVTEDRAGEYSTVNMSSLCTLLGMCALTRIEHLSIFWVHLVTEQNMITDSTCGNLFTVTLCPRSDADNTTYKHSKEYLTLKCALLTHIVPKCPSCSFPYEPLWKLSASFYFFKRPCVYVSQPSIWLPEICETYTEQDNIHCGVSLTKYKVAQSYYINPSRMSERMQKPFCGNPEALKVGIPEENCWQNWKRLFKCRVPGKNSKYTQPTFNAHAIKSSGASDVMSGDRGHEESHTHTYIYIYAL